MAALPSAHSPLGASGAFRWLPEPWGGGCYASAALSMGTPEFEEDEEFSAPGVAAHALAETCLTYATDAWQRIGQELEGVEVDKEMADAVQVYLDNVRGDYPDRHQGNSWVERSFHCPSIHELFYGTADFVYWDQDARTLHVWDYKHGAGIVVEAYQNPQCLYYAAGVLEDLDLWDHVDTVVVHIAQPRGFHWAGPIRSWEITTSELEDWIEDVLIPGMDKALVSRETASGDHCRFCPARYRQCPQLLADQEELWGIMKLAGVPIGGTHEEMEAAVKEAFSDSGVSKLTNDQLARGLDLLDLTPIMKKAYDRTAYNRMTEAGIQVPRRKLVYKRANRVFKDGAEAAAKKEFKKRAFTEPVLKSPAKIDEMAGGTKFTARWAAKPKAGMKVAAASDKGAPIPLSDVSKLFKPVKKGAK